MAVLDWFAVTWLTIVFLLVLVAILVLCLRGKIKDRMIATLRWELKNMHTTQTISSQSMHKMVFDRDLSQEKIKQLERQLEEQATKMDHWQQTQEYRGRLAARLEEAVQRVRDYLQTGQTD